MKTFVLALIVALLAVASASAHGPGWNKHHQDPTNTTPAPTTSPAPPAQPAAVDPSFVCDGTSCVFHVDGLTPGAKYQSSLEFVPANGGSGCDVGTNALPADASGALTITYFEQWTVECGKVPVAGTVTAWLRAEDSQDWADPPVLLSDGSQALVTASIGG